MNALTRGSYPFSLVGLGGSFDHLHEGHKVLLRTAFKLGQKVAIGLTSDEMVKEKQYKELLETYSNRKANLMDVIETEIRIPRDDYEIIELTDPFGPAITNNAIEAHVSSIETYEIAIKINQKRLERNLNPLTLIIIPLIYDEHGRKLSSTNIRGKFSLL